MFLVISHNTLLNEFQVQIRPWNLADSDYVMDSTQPLDPRKTVFVGGVPRPLRAGETSFCTWLYYTPAFDGMAVETAVIIILVSYSVKKDNLMVGIYI